MAENSIDQSGSRTLKRGLIAGTVYLSMSILLSLAITGISQVQRKAHEEWVAKPNQSYRATITAVWDRYNRDLSYDSMGMRVRIDDPGLDRKKFTAYIQPSAEDQQGRLLREFSGTLRDHLIGSETDEVTLAGKVDGVRETFFVVSSVKINGDGYSNN